MSTPSVTPTSGDVDWAAWFAAQQEVLANHGVGVERHNDGAWYAFTLDRQFGASGTTMWDALANLHQMRESR